MLAPAFAIALAAGTAIPAGDFLPDAQDMRMQTIHRAQDEKAWPFVADGGVLLCAKVMSEPTVFFVPDEKPPATRAMVLDIDLFGMSMSNLGITNVLRPYASLEELLKRITPFVTMGRQLCNQPPGTNITGSEL